MSTKRTRKQRFEYIKGPEAKNNFEKAMKAIFQIRKAAPKKTKKGKD